jgi:hypothetical protein
MVDFSDNLHAKVIPHLAKCLNSLKFSASTLSLSRVLYIIITIMMALFFSLLNFIFTDPRRLLTRYEG